MPNRPCRRAYDHRLRELVIDGAGGRAGAAVAAALRVPRSTVASWKRRDHKPVVSHIAESDDRAALAAENAKLRRRIEIHCAIVRLLVVLVRCCRAQVDASWLPSGSDRADLLRAIVRTQPALRLRDALRIVGLSPVAYHVWRKHPLTCTAEPTAHAGNCPRARPRRLTATEVANIREMTIADEFRHVSIARLSVLARRLGRVFASVRTWHELVKRHGWRRPRRRIYPPKPKVGVRANAPNELWHIDVTVVNLLDGGRAFVQAIIDNFSRRILAWRVSPTLDPCETARLLTEAAALLPAGTVPTTVCDSGVENLNGDVDALVSGGALRRILARVEVAYSNSMIEAFWRQLKHDWLYLNVLDSVATVRKLVAFYVEQHNSVLPHRALGVRTPDEVYFARVGDLDQLLRERARDAAALRAAANRKVDCRVCVDARHGETVNDNTGVAGATGIV